jgi:hypothetical protein
LYDLDDKKTYDEIQRKWYNSSKPIDKLSSLAQAKHIDIKLKALGLQKLKSDKNAEALLRENRLVFDNILKEDRDTLCLSDKFLKEYSHELNKMYAKKEFEVKYFPKDFKTIFEKLIRSEHNRWNAFHYLNGWKYANEKNKNKKEHNYLTTLDKFSTLESQITVLYDIYSILYIPNYLANAGYAIQIKEDNKHEY